MNESFTFWCMSVSSRAVGLFRSSLSSGSAASPEQNRGHRPASLSLSLSSLMPLISPFSSHSASLLRGCFDLPSPAEASLPDSGNPWCAQRTEMFLGGLSCGSHWEESAWREKQLDTLQTNASCWEKVQRLMFAHYPQSYRNQRHFDSCRIGGGCLVQLIYLKGHTEPGPGSNPGSSLLIIKSYTSLNNEPRAWW